MKQFSIIVGFLFVLAIDAQYYSTIPCKTDLTCKDVLDPNQEIRCINGICMCANTSTRSFEFCTNKDFMTGATHRDAGKKLRNCSEDADCASITGAKCYPEPIGEQKVCDCQPSHVLSSSGQHCLSIATELLSPCNETVQCSTKLDGAECAEGRCRCRPNFHYAASKKRCILNKGVDTRSERSCEKYGHYCSGGHGKRSISASAVLEEMLRTTKDAAEVVQAEDYELTKPKVVSLTLAVPPQGKYSQQANSRSDVDSATSRYSSGN